jgi:hypothetical protein
MHTHSNSHNVTFHFYFFSILTKDAFFFSSFTGLSLTSYEGGKSLAAQSISSMQLPYPSSARTLVIHCTVYFPSHPIPFQCRYQHSSYIHTSFCSDAYTVLTLAIASQLASPRSRSRVANPPFVGRISVSNHLPSWLSKKPLRHTASRSLKTLILPPFTRSVSLFNRRILHWLVDYGESDHRSGVLVIRLSVYFICTN